VEEGKVEASADQVLEKRGGGFVEGGAYLSWHHLNYSVFTQSGVKKKELQLLHDVSGYVKPGMMLALMVRAFLHSTSGSSPRMLRMTSFLVVMERMLVRVRRAPASRR